MIDWERKFEFLDTELAKSTPKSLTGKRQADKLVKVYRAAGVGAGAEAQAEEFWLYIHIEVQGYDDPSFVERMYIYNYRVFDRFYQVQKQGQGQGVQAEFAQKRSTARVGKQSKASQNEAAAAVKIMSLAVLTDDNPDYRPNKYQVSEVGGYELKLRFPTAKLIDYNAEWAELESNTNPFAVLVMAHLKYQQERGSPQQLLDWKVRLVEQLYQRNYSQKQTRQLLRFIDWLMLLPPELDRIAEERISQLEEKKVAYVTSFEPLGMERGLERGMKQGSATLVLRQLKKRFGEIKPEVQQQLENELTTEQLEQLGEALLDFKVKADLVDWLNSVTMQSAENKNDVSISSSRPS